MPSMRLGTRVAVINDLGEILLSKRSDLGTWELPGGRVDSHELIHESAAREVLEETGLKVEIERPVGLYFQQGRGRTNILYRAKPIGGTLFDKTDETLGNQFFALDNLPDNFYGDFYIGHAYYANPDITYLYTVVSPIWLLIKLDIQLRWRWVHNLLAGRPEPKFPDIEVRAVGIVKRNGLVYVTQDNQLPCIVSDGRMALEVALTQHIQPLIKAPLLWEWVGLYQDTNADTIEFVFAANVDSKAGLWVQSDNLNGRYRQYLEMSPQNIWLLQGAS
jgi:8-oxo-dGTP pyrophosphatase MutT (NUDIX family)